MAKKYVNKLQHYSYNSMVSRTQLTVIDNNCIVGREEAITISGDEHSKYVHVHLKQQKQQLVKPIYEKNSCEFVNNLLSDTILLKKGKIELPDLERPHSTKHCIKSLGKQRRHHFKACVNISINFLLLQVTGYCYMVPHCLNCEINFTFLHLINFVPGLHE